MFFGWLLLDVLLLGFFLGGWLFLALFLVGGLSWTFLKWAKFLLQISQKWSFFLYMFRLMITHQCITRACMRDTHARTHTQTHTHTCAHVYAIITVCWHASKCVFNLTKSLVQITQKFSSFLMPVSANEYSTVYDNAPRFHDRASDMGSTHGPYRYPPSSIGRSGRWTWAAGNPPFVLMNWSCCFGGRLHFINPFREIQAALPQKSSADSLSMCPTPVCICTRKN